MLRILLIEDSVRFRQTVKMVLSTFFPSIEIDEAGDGRDAMEKIQTASPDLIITDVSLPGENGIQIARRIRKAYPDLPIAMLTGSDLPEYETASFRAGANYFLSKRTSTGEQLAHLVESVMANRGKAVQDTEPDVLYSFGNEVALTA